MYINYRSLKIVIEDLISNQIGAILRYENKRRKRRRRRKRRKRNKRKGIRRRKKKTTFHNSTITPRYLSGQSNHS
jgi:hypothetical protein